MPVQPTYPGVYVQEVPSGVRTIMGVSTSVAAFIDYFKRGLMNYPIKIFSLGDFEREFGGLDTKSEASYSIQQFFLNGGTEAWVIRTASGGVKAASVEIQSSVGGATALIVEAGRFDPAKKPETINPGDWGNDLRVIIDYPEPNSDNRFNLSVLLVENRKGIEFIKQSEFFMGLSMDINHIKFVGNVINDEFSGSKLVRVAAQGNQLPLQTGTISGNLSVFPTITSPNPQVNVSIGTDRATVILKSVPTSLEQARRLLESAIRASRPELSAFSQANVSISDNGIVNQKHLRIKAGLTNAISTISFAQGGIDPTASNLGLLTGQYLEGILTNNLSGLAFPGPGPIDVKIGGSTSTINLSLVNNIAALRSELESKIRVAGGIAPADQIAFSQVRVIQYTDGVIQQLFVLAGEPGKIVSISNSGPNKLADSLHLSIGPATSINVYVSDNLTSLPVVIPGNTISVRIGGLGTFIATIGNNANTLDNIAEELQNAIRSANAHPSYANASVAAYGTAIENRLVVLAGNIAEQVIFSASPADLTTVNELHLNTVNGAIVNLQRYVLGAGAGIPNTAQGFAEQGANGNPPDGIALIGDLNAKTGIYSLEDVDIFNILCIPRTAEVGNDPCQLTEAESEAVIQTANVYCERKRAFFIIDTRIGINDFQEIKNWMDNNSDLRHKNNALYFPRIEIPDPLTNFHPRSLGASGTIAGLYSKIDSNRGVWKAPAGIEAKLINISKLEYNLSDNENGALNQIAINCLRTFPVYGCVSWGARTLDGADQIGSEWKYIPVRRTALFIEESLYRGLKWVVFEPNDEPLWSQIRLNVGAFMNNLFRQGAFQGMTPKEAYFVKCDKETTTQNDINQGIVNIWVGFAPLKPAEFVMLYIQQIAGKINQ